MKFVCFGYHDLHQWADMPPQERQEMLAENQAYENELRGGGHVLGCQALQPPATATTLRFQAGQLTVTDGPFAETKEQLGGFLVLEADDLDQAIRLMSKLPCMRWGGSVEIRPIEEDVYGQIAAAAAAAV